MGGVPALLLVIAAGITYGWQPDREGGVEYIIQVPPDQVERLAEIGEISSVIDPEVRGHVSRVVIRVGTGPLPQNTPANLSGRSAVTPALGSSDLALLDASPVPIPEMMDSNVPEPIPGLDRGPTDGELSVLKPDANSPQGTSGYGYPSLPPTLSGTSPQIDQAGREISAPPSSQASSIFGSPTPNPSPTTSSTGTVRIPPPSTRTPAPTSTSAATPPPFTGSDPQGDYARARAGGPSTDPTNGRDNTWRDFPPPPTSTTSGVSSAGASNENPFQTPNATSTSVSGSGYPNTGTNGLAPGDTYGKLPSGFSFAGSGDRSSAGAPSASAQPNAFGTPNYGTTSNGNVANSSSSGSSPAYATGPDPRLTPVQVAAGAWSVDSYGRILDRQGRVMTASSFVSPSATAAAANVGGTTNQNSSTNPNFGAGTSYGASDNYAGSGFTTFGAGGNTASSSQLNSSLGSPTTQASTGFTQMTGNGNASPSQPFSRTLPTDFGAIRSTAENQGSFDQRGSVRTTSATSPVDSVSNESYMDRRNDPPSLSDRRSSSGTTAGDSGREVVAPQPLFNGLLLISLVANVYLIFWLKNLRIQFRELVAAKRMAASSSSQ